MRLVPILGLKIDKTGLDSISPNRVRAMYASGAVSSMLLPWLTIPAGYAISLPIGILITVLTLGNDLFTLHFSIRVGDLHHARMVRG
jgi:hypothetical protein